MASTEDDDVASRQLEWLRKVREAVHLTGPPPPEVLRSLAPPEEDGSDDDVTDRKTSEPSEGRGSVRREQREPISPTSPKVVEELASLRWELQDRQRTVTQLEELVDLLQTRCRELEDESRELVDLAASKHEQEQLEAGVPHERRDEDDYIASIKERQLSREPIPPLGRTSLRSNERSAGSSERDAELERLKLRCDDLEEERMHLAAELELSQTECANLAEALEKKDRGEEDDEADEREDLHARCTRLEAEKEKLQKHVERLWQMSEAQAPQARQGSAGELTFQAATERAVTDKLEDERRLSLALEENGELQVLVETLTSQVKDLEERLAAEEEAGGEAARCQELTREKAELEKELGELAVSVAEVQGNLKMQHELRARAEEALRAEQQAREEAEARLLAAQDAPKASEAAAQLQLQAVSAEKEDLQQELEDSMKEVARLKAQAEEQSRLRAKAEASLDAERLAREEVVRRSAEGARTEMEAPRSTASPPLQMQLQALEAQREDLQQELDSSLKEAARLKGQVEEQTRLRAKAEASLDAERLAREEVVRRSMESSRSLAEMEQELQRHAEGLASAVEQRQQVEAQKVELQQELASLVQTQRTVEATHAIQLDGLRERNELLTSENEDLKARLELCHVQEGDASRHVLEEELALLRRQLEERPLRQEVVAAPSAVPEDLQAQLVQLQAERQQLEAECARRTAQKEELVLQLEEALAKSESVQLKELQQSLDEAEAAQQRLSQQWSSAKKQLQHAKAEGDMLTSELQKLGQQLQDSQAQTEALQRECDELRARYNNLEADHSDLNLRAEEALAGHEALTAEHQRVIEQAKQLQSRQGLEDEGLRKTHQALEAELLKVQAERDILAKQVKDQELYTAARQEDLKADAERLRDENLARADEWKAIVSELADLRSSRAALDTKCAELIDKAADASEECQKQRGLAESFRSESETLKGELQQLQKAVLDAASQQQITAEEAERLRNEAAELEATRRALQREVDEYRRQMETSSVERGASEAELARLEACAEALAEENHQLRSRIDTLAPKDAEEAYAAAIISAEQWVLYHAGMPLEGTSMPYLSGVTISFAEFYAPLLSLVFASPPQQLRSAAAAVESGELARASLQCFRLCDAQRVGRLTWEEVQDLSDAVFQRKGLPTPSQDVQYLMFTKFDKECASRLHAQDCLCWVDALFRAMLMSPAAVAARVSEAPEGPIVSGPRSGAAPAPSEARLLQESVAQGRLQKRLDEAQSAAERAVAAAGSRSEPLTATANSGLDGMLLSGREGVPRASQPVYRTEGPHVKLLDPARIRQSQ